MAMPGQMVPEPVNPAGAPVATMGGGIGAALGVSSRSLELLYGVDMAVTVELGRTRMSVKDLLSLRPGRIIELDRSARAPVDILVNNTLLARGEVVVVDEELGVRVTEIVTGSDRQVV
jgi:flagellar motor switch protein FliN/FliY